MCDNILCHCIISPPVKNKATLSKIDHIANAFCVFFFSSSAKARNLSSVSSTLRRWKERQPHHILYDLTGPIPVEIIENMHVKAILITLGLLHIPLLHQFKSMLGDDPLMFGIVRCRFRTHAILPTITCVFDGLLIFINVQLFSHIICRAADADPSLPICVFGNSTIIVFSFCGDFGLQRRWFRCLRPRSVCSTSSICLNTHARFFTSLHNGRAVVVDSLCLALQGRLLVRRRAIFHCLRLDL